MFVLSLFLNIFRLTLFFLQIVYKSRSARDQQVFSNNNKKEISFSLTILAIEKSCTGGFGFIRK